MNSEEAFLFIIGSTLLWKYLQYKKVVLFL